MSSIDLKPGGRLRHRDGAVVTLNCRKRPDDGRSTTPYSPGWWLTCEDAAALIDGSGSAP